MATNDHYCTASDVYQFWGQTNVRIWADLDAAGNTTNITARVQWAIDATADRMDAELRRTKYTIPVTDSSGAVPGIVRTVCSALTGVLLYEAKGSMDVDPKSGLPVHKLSAAKQTYEGQLKGLAEYVLKLDY